MRIGTVAAARAGRGLRPAGIAVGGWRPAELIAIGHGNLLVVTALAWGTAIGRAYVMTAASRLARRTRCG